MITKSEAEAIGVPALRIALRAIRKNKWGGGVSPLPSWPQGTIIGGTVKGGFAPTSADLGNASGDQLVSLVLALASKSDPAWPEPKIRKMLEFGKRAAAEGKSSEDAPHVQADGSVVDAPAPAVPPAPTAAQSADVATAAQTFAAVLAAASAGSVNEAKVEEIAQRVTAEALAKSREPSVTVISLEIKRPDGPSVKIERAHKQLPDLKEYAEAREPVFMWGAAAGGKTTAFNQLAAAFGVPKDRTAIQSLCQETPASALVGFMAPEGYRGTAFRRIFEHGGWILLDEVDGAAPNTLLQLNAAVENGRMLFPDGMVERHPDCWIAAAGNTKGLGGTAEFTGRSRLDGAFLSRFGTMEWEYDEALELAAAPVPAWTRYVQAFRAECKARGVRGVVATPRASFKGGKLLRTGRKLDKVIREYLTAPLEPATAQAIIGKLGTPSIKIIDDAAA